MSGGSGLLFVVCVPTEEYEREKFGNNGSNGLHPPLTPVPSYETAITLHQNNLNGQQHEDTEVKTPQPAEQESLEQVLRKTLEELRIYDAVWVLDESEKFHKVTFACDPGLKCDFVLTTLTTNGIGMCKGSTLGILPCSVLLQDDDLGLGCFKNDMETMTLLPEDQKKRSESDSSTLSKTKSDIKKAFRGFKEMQKKFLKTVTARLTVAQVVEGVRAGAEPSFDFIMFVIVASMLAALGLLENSSVVIVASMLISPIMGPILAATFGAVIRDKSLRNQGIQTEIVGLFLCLALGYVFGLFGGLLNNYLSSQDWPNNEMLSRATERGLWIGLLIALPSGVGVALSVLGGNAASLVGVAISASLLPPAVDAGLFWGLATIRNIRAQDEIPRFMLVNGQTRLTKPSLAPNEGYNYVYYPEMDREYAMLGLMSLALALINIACIFVAAVLVLKIKEVAPKTSLSKTSRFWKEDIKIARDFNAAMAPSKPENLGDQFLAEWASLNGLEPDEVLSDDTEARITRMETLKDIMQDVEADEVYQTIAHSITSKGQTRPLSERISMISPSQRIPSDLDVPAYGRSPQTSRSLMISDPGPKKQPHSVDGDTTHPDLTGVELRRPHKQQQQQSDSSKRSSVAILRQSLRNTTLNPYTLWPSALHSSPAGMNRFSRYRSIMDPVPEDAVLGGPFMRHRVSHLLNCPEVVVKETTC